MIASPVCRLAEKHTETQLKRFRDVHVCGVRCAMCGLWRAERATSNAADFITSNYRKLWRAGAVIGRAVRRAPERILFALRNASIVTFLF